MKRKLLIFAAIFTLAFGSGQKAHAQWVQVNGLYGGFISALAVSDSNLFAGTENEGIFRSTDYGASWNSVTTGFPSIIGVDAFAVSDTDLYAGTTDNGVFLSTNNGASWISLGFIDVSSLAVSGENLIIGTNNGVAILTDNGNKWVSDCLINTQVNALAVIGTKFFAGTATGVFESTDSGATWVAVDAGLIQHGDTLGVHALTASGMNLFAAAGGGVYRSTNNGASWNVVDTEIPANININSFAVLDSNLFVGSNNLYVGSGEGGVFRSPDNGKSWLVADTGLPTYSNFTSFAISGTNLFVGTQSDGLFLSTDNGSSWRLTSISLVNKSNVPALAVMGSNLFAGSNNGVFLSTDSGTTWRWTNGGLSSSVTALAVSGTNIFAGTYYDSVYLSTDSGKSWSAESEGLPTDDYLDYVAAFVASGTNLYARTASQLSSYIGSVYCSTNNGTSWTSLDTSNLHITAFAVIGNELFAGTANDGVYLSTDNGGYWGWDGQGIPSGVGVSSLVAFGTKLFAGCGEVFLSTDSGVNWEVVSKGQMDDAPISTFLIVDSNLFAGTGYANYGVGVFLTTNSDGNWADIGLDNLNEYIGIQSLAASGNFLYAGTGSAQEGGEGVWRLELSQVIGSSSVQIPLSVQQLISCYPNPFPQSTTITLTTPASGAAELSVVNVLGEEVARLYDGELGAGEHSFTFNASGLAPGTYWCVMRSNSLTQELPMILTR